MNWRSISRLVPNWQAGKRMEKELRLAQAYRAVFCGSPTRDDQQIVLADMLANSGFCKVTGFKETSRTIWYVEGMRAMYASVWRHLSLSDADIRELENAARVESAQFEDQSA